MIDRLKPPPSTRLLRYYQGVSQTAKPLSSSGNCKNFYGMLQTSDIFSCPDFVATPPKTNMEPQNGGLEDDFPFQTGDFQVPC